MSKKSRRNRPNSKKKNKQNDQAVVKEEEEVLAPVVAEVEEKEEEKAEIDMSSGSKKQMTVDSLKIPAKSKMVKTSMSTVDVKQLSNFISADWLAEISQFVNEVDFETFGKMNSAAYRQLFFRLATAANLTAEATSFVLLLMTLIKNKGRILNAMADEEIVKSSDMAKMALKFITDHCVQYVNDEKRQVAKNFPVVKGPESFSSLSVLYASMFNKNITAHWLIYQSYFANQNLSDFLQDLNEMAARYQWTQQITNTKNESKKRPKDKNVGTFYREIYKNQRSDNHDFLTVSGDAYIFRATKPEKKPISIRDIIKYIRECNLDKKEDKQKFMFIHAEWKLFHPAFDENGTQMYDYDKDGVKSATEKNGLLAKLMIDANPVQFVYESELVKPIAIV